MERTKILGITFWWAPGKWREQELWVSGFGVRQTKGENRKRGFQAVVCARQMVRKE